MLAQVRLDGVDETVLLHAHQLLATFLRERFPDVHPVARRRPRFLRLQRVDEASLVFLALRNRIQNFVALQRKTEWGRRE